MSRLEKLYESMILEHNRNPRHFHELSPCTHSSHGKNPLCGDDYHVYVKVDDGMISDISFHGSGCAISKASGSLMTDGLVGKSVEEGLAIKDHFIQLVTEDASDDVKQLLGKLKVFEGVRKFPVRVKCAALVWRTLEDALSESTGQVSTE